MSKTVQTIYDDESWKQYLPEIEKLIADDLSAFYSDEENSAVAKEIEEAKQAHYNYKKKFNWALYYTLLIFSPILVLLIIPAFWVIKKLIKMNKLRKELKDKFNKENSERLHAIKSSVRKINFYKLIEKSMYHIGYKWQGPIPSNFVRTLNKYVVFKSDYVNNSQNKNNYISSWGTFNDQLVVVNLSTKTHAMVMKTYKATEYFKYNNTTEGVTASYEHPFPEYETNYIVSVFSPACEGLKFKLKEYHYKPLINRQGDDKYVPFANKTFDKCFKIKRDNEAMVRMVYTADVQEYLVHKRELYKGELPDYLKYYKSGSLFSSEYLVKNPFCSKWAFDWNILNDISIEMEAVLAQCSKIIIDIVRQRFLSLNFATSIPLLMTQFDGQLIKELNSLYQSTEITPEDTAYAQYVLNVIWEDEILKCDTQIMNIFDIKSKKIISGNLVVASQFTAFGYKGVKKTKPVTVVTQSGVRVVNVPYIDYISTSNNAFFYYARINTSSFYIRGYSDFPQEMINVIENSGLKEKIIIKNRHIALVDSNGELYGRFENLLRYFAQDEQNDDLLKNLIDFSAN